MSWKHKPSPSLINTLVESTPGFSGADLQALCADAIVRCMKRVYPGVHDRAGVKIEPEKLRVRLFQISYFLKKNNRISGGGM